MVETFIVHHFYRQSHGDVPVHICHRGIAEFCNILYILYILQSNKHFQIFFFKCTTVLWSGKENVILTMYPIGQSQSKITAVNGSVDQLKPDSHFDSQIDPYISCILIECVCSRMPYKC